jgi:hypothetical protein
MMNIRYNMKTGANVSEMPPPICETINNEEHRRPGANPIMTGMIR